MNFFRNIIDFLNMCEDYIDLRVRTGKYVEDVAYVSQTVKETSQHELEDKKKHVIKAKYTQMTVRKTLKYWRIITSIPIIGDIIAVLFGTVRLLVLFLIEYATLLSLTLITFAILLQHFETSGFLFVTMFLPTLWINALLTCWLYYRIGKYDMHEPVSIKQSLLDTFHHLSGIIILVCLHVFTLLTLLITFILIAFSLSLVFSFFHIMWQSSFFYWLVTIPLGLLMLIALFLFNVIAFQAYFFVILHQQNPFHSLKLAWRYFKGYPFQLMFFHTLFLIINIASLLWAYNNHSYLGIMLALFSGGQLMMLVTYLLSKRFPYTIPVESAETVSHERQLFLFLFTFGAITFFLSSLLLLREYPKMQDFLWKEQQKRIVAAQMTQYYNETYSYAINYPKSWSVYTAEEDKDFPIIYNNYNGNYEGGIWIKIAVLDAKTADYENLRASKPGLVAFNTRTETVLFKISNILIQEYEGVKYTYSIPEDPEKPDESQPQYQTHYLIKKGDKFYDVSFITVSKVVESDNQELFETIISSFHFIK